MIRPLKILKWAVIGSTSLADVPDQSFVRPSMEGLFSKRKLNFRFGAIEMLFVKQVAHAMFFRFKPSCWLLKIFCPTPTARGSVGQVPCLNTKKNRGFCWEVLLRKPKNDGQLGTYCFEVRLRNFCWYKFVISMMSSFLC